MRHLVSGFFGKLPSRGDFLQSGLPADFVSLWDQWLQTIIHQAQQQRGDDWLSPYLSMPIWHFALAANVCGESAITGVLMTSVDSAGRYFPMTLAVACSSSDDSKGLPLLLADRIDVAWALEDIALAALQNTATYEAFLNQIESLALPQKCRFLTSQEQSVASTSLSQSLVTEALLVRRSDWTQTSLWWGNTETETHLIVEDGLPSPDRFATILMVDGNMKADLTNASANDVPHQDAVVSTVPDVLDPDVAVADTAVANDHVDESRSSTDAIAECSESIQP
jgi:type VI secretion system protein ImpM